MRPLSARDVPELWSTLVGHWQPGHAFDNLAATVGPADLAAGEHRWCVQNAKLWFITADMTALIQAAAPSLPATTLTPGLVPHGPDGAGLAVFATPIVGRDAKADDREVTVNALLWGNGTYDGAYASGDVVAINSYSLVAGGGDQLGPLGGGHWRYGDDFDDRWPPNQADGAHASCAEDRRWLACLLLLAAEPIAHTGMWHNRPQRRQWARAGRPPPPEVRLVDVRRRATPRRGPGGERQAGGKHSYRYPVSGFWRQQPYGPGRAYRRPKWIEGHTRGPDDAPLIIRHDVHVLRTGPDEQPEDIMKGPHDDGRP